MAQPKVLVLTGYGINCDEETKFAFEKSGATADIIHINDIIENKKLLTNYQVFSFPGGFSYGDDTGSGKALASKIQNGLRDEFLEFMEKDVLMLGICNGFQVMVNLGIVPGYSGLGEANVSLEHNTSNRYQCRWVNLKINTESNCVFTKGINTLKVPVAHGEGNFYADQDILEKLEKKNQTIMKYTKEDGTPANGEFPFNPNGAMNDIAAVCDASGRFMGMMPHPERNILFTHKDNWTVEKEALIRSGKPIPEESEGILIFRNAVNYFK